MPIPTPHINAKKEDFAKTVLMPGDPLRAKFIAETFLTEPRLVNNVRGVQGHTGTWKGVPVTVMASGMGMPSIGIYSWELFNFYDVKNIIRIGSAGALQDDLKLRDIVAGQAACTNSNYVKSFGFGDSATFAPIADYTLLSTAVNVAKAHGVSIRVGNIVSSPVCQRRLCRQARAVHLHHLGPHLSPGGQPLGGGSPELVHADDGDRPGHGHCNGSPVIILLFSPLSCFFFLLPT